MTKVEELSVLRRYQHIWLGLLFLAITPLSIIPGLPFFSENPQNWWNSVSQTYYSNTSMVMIYSFTLIGIISLVYRAKNIAERIVMILMGISSILVVAFPHALNEETRTVFFHVSGALSCKVHFVAAGICFFAILARSFMFIPAKAGVENSHQKNVFYIVSTFFIFLGCFLVIFARMNVIPGFFVLVSEFIMFSLYGIEFLISTDKIKE